MLEKIAAEMKARAIASKLDVKNGVFPSVEDSIRQVAVGDTLCKLMLTCDIYPEKGELWHLSFSTIPYGTVPEELADRIKKAFFGEAEVINFPSFLHGNKMKQYLARVSL